MNYEIINESNNIYIPTTEYLFWSVVSTQPHSLSLHGALHNYSVGFAVYLVDQRYVHLDLIIA